MSNINTEIAENFLTVKDAAQKFSIRETSIRWWLWLGLFPIYRFGRTVMFKESEFSDFLDQHRQETKIVGGAIK